MSANLTYPDDSLRSDEEILFEVIDGEPREVQPMGAYENIFAFRLARLIQDFADRTRLGQAAVETLFVLRTAPLLQRRPDVAFVSRTRIQQHRLRRTSAWDVVPDLAIEVVSVTNLADEIDEKLVDYFSAGVRQVWVISPETRRVYVYQSLQSARVYADDEMIDATPVLPGFTFRLADLFDAIDQMIDDEA